VADLTYISTKDGFRYASLIMDAASRKIVGYKLSASLSLEGASRRSRGALADAPEEATDEEEGLIHHSARGVQPCGSAPYTGELRSAGAKVSMAAVGNPYENAQAERARVGTLKREYLMNSLFASEQQAREVLSEAVRLYNQERPHEALGYDTPAAAHSSGEQACKEEERAPRRHAGTASTPGPPARRDRQHAGTAAPEQPN
jgi:transposase InsO family protein